MRLEEEEFVGFQETDVPDRRNLLSRANLDTSSESLQEEQPCHLPESFPVPAFQIWLQEEGKAAIKDSHPDASPTEIAKCAGAAWAALDLQTRNVYEARYRAAQLLWKQSRAKKRNHDSVAPAEGGNPSDEVAASSTVSPQEEAAEVSRGPTVRKKSPREIANMKKDQKTLALKMAVAKYKAGIFSSLNKAAKEHGVVQSTLYRAIVGEKENSEEFPGSGRYSSRLSSSEEKKILDFVVMRQQIGYGLDWAGLQRLVQEVLLALITSDPSRKTGLEHCGQLPGKSWVRRFADRHNLVSRKTLEISKGRQIITPEDLALWQADAYTFFSSDRALAAAMLDPARMWNQDESSVQVLLK